MRGGLSLRPSFWNRLVFTRALLSAQYPCQTKLSYNHFLGLLARSPPQNLSLSRLLSFFSVFVLPFTIYHLHSYLSHIFLISSPSVSAFASFRCLYLKKHLSLSSFSVSIFATVLKNLSYLSKYFIFSFVCSVSLSLIFPSSYHIYVFLFLFLFISTSAGLFVCSLPLPSSFSFWFGRFELSLPSGRCRRHRHRQRQRHRHKPIIS